MKSAEIAVLDSENDVNLPLKTHVKPLKPSESTSGCRLFACAHCFLCHLAGLLPPHLTVVRNANRLSLKDFQVVEEWQLLIVQVFNR